MSVNSVCSLPVVLPSWITDPPTVHEHCNTKAHSHSWKETVLVLGTACWGFAICAALLGCFPKWYGHPTSAKSCLPYGARSCKHSSVGVQAGTLSQHCRSELAVHFMSCLFYIFLFKFSFFFLFLFNYFSF